MKQTLKKKYKFNLKTGHYDIILNEDEQTTTDDNKSSETSGSKTDAGLEKAQDNSTEKQSIVNLESQEVIALRQAKEAKVKPINDAIYKLNSTISSILAKYADLEYKYNKSVSDGSDFDMSAINSILKQKISALVQLASKQYELAKANYDYDTKILKQQSTLVESKKYMFDKNSKYGKLNESNMQAAKVYITVLVNEISALKSMVDIRRVFGQTGLLYGKDKQGYFVICVDQEDFDVMYDTLLQIGYQRDSIIDAIMPQIFDRRKLIN